MTARTDSSAQAIAVIIGRAGSKGLPGKNAMSLGGEPMVCHSIRAARAARTVKRIVVSTDGPEIAAAAAAMGATVIDRPPALATDTAPVDAAVRHAVECAGAPAEPVVVILYANVPLRPADLIDRAVAELAATGADSVQSYADVGKHHPYWMVKLEDGGRVAPFHPNAIDRRQDLPELLLPDGGVIAVTRTALLAAAECAGNPHAFFGTDRRGIRTGAECVIDIDEAADLHRAEARLAPRGGAGGAAACDAVTIGDRDITPDGPPYIIAEIGVNHDGSVDRALELVDAAAAARADAVKLQLFETDRLLSRAARLAAYQRATEARDPFELLRALEMPAAQMAAIVARAHAASLHAIVSVFSRELVADAERLPFDAYKVASPDLINAPLIRAMTATGKPVLLSAGAATRVEIVDAVERLGAHPHVLMHCVSSYPTPDDEAGLGRRLDLADIDPWALGYSDHTTSVDTGALAVAAGACVLEKHLTWNRAATGPDHAASLAPAGFAEYVALAHRAWRMRGPVHAPEHGGVRDIERDVRSASRQSLTTTRALPEGHVLGPGDLTVKRPGTGLPPDQLETVEGLRVVRAIEADMPLTREHVA